MRDMARRACLAFLVVLLISLILPRPARAQTAPTAAKTGAIRMFLDCQWQCDQEFLKKEITFVDWMRDRADADVHVLVTSQGTGGGGSEYTLKFIGLGRFANVEQTLRYFSTNTSTSDEIRNGILEVLKRGLVRYVSESALASKLKITFEAPAAGDAAKTSDPKNDPWNLWVFRAGVGGNLSGEQSTDYHSVRGSASATRTTELNRVSLTASMNYSVNNYDLSDTETYKSISRNVDANGIFVKGLNQHWSLGLMGSASSSTFLNYEWRVRIAPGVEYNFFPYADSTRRMFTVQYTVGGNYNDYTEVTIYDKTEEKLFDHRLESGLSLRQPWGTVGMSVNFTQYLTDPDKYRLSAFGDASVRLFKGFEFNVFGEASRTRDQINLRRGEATTEEILVRQRQLASGYSYYMSFSVSYSFGSIFNNIVNPRFGGGGGFCC
jgi:hypothetical protein